MTVQELLAWGLLICLLLGIWFSPIVDAVEHVLLRLLAVDDMGCGVMDALFGQEVKKKQVSSISKMYTGQRLTVRSVVLLAPLLPTTRSALLLRMSPADSSLVRTIMVNPSLGRSTEPWQTSTVFPKRSQP